MKKRKWARMVSGRTVATHCPNCLTKLEAVTAVALESEFERLPNGKVKISGEPTRCGYCFALLVFSDEQGHLRLMLPEERANYKLDPFLIKVLDGFRAKTKQPDFTRRNYN